MSDWEKSVIGTVLTDPGAMEAASELRPSDFSGPHRAIWAEILLLHNQGTLDLRALLNILPTSPDWPRLAQPGRTPEQYMTEIMGFRGSDINTYVAHVIEDSVRRELRSNAALIAAEADNQRKTTDELLEYAENKILALRRNRSEDGIMLGDIISSYMPRLEGMRAGERVQAWVPNIAGIRSVIKYAEDTEFIVIASRPGEGKSSVLRFEAKKFADNGGRVCIFNFENDQREYVRYMISVVSGVNSDLLKSPELMSPQQMDAVKRAAQQLARLPIKIYDAAGWSVLDVTRRARKWASEGPGIMMVDYIQLIDNGIAERVQDISKTTRDLRAFALRFKIPVIAAAQLSREIERRGVDSEPQLSDLRESGSIEQDATQVWFPRNAWNNPTAEDIGMFPENRTGQGLVNTDRIRAIPVKFYIKKNRNGSTGVTDPIKWDKALNIFTTLTRDSIR